MLELHTVREQLELPAAAGESGEGGSDLEGVALVEEAAPAKEAMPTEEAEAAEYGLEGEVVETFVEGEVVETLEEEDPEPLDAEQVQTLTARLERLRRRREQLGPVNPLAKEEYAEALVHVEELEARRSDLETALRELRTLIRDTDRQIHETFRATFDAAARNFEELTRDLFPGGGGELRLVKDALAPRPVLGGQSLPGATSGVGGGTGASGAGERDGEAAAEREEQGAIGRAAAAERGDGEGRDREGGEGEVGEDLDTAGSGYDPGEELLGVEIEITPAGKSTKRLSLLSGGEKSMTALAFLFAVFLARPCPFYILDEVEAALDDLNLERFLSLLRRYADRAQFIVITHQKRTMEAADWLYGVSMAGNGVSKVLSRRLPPAGGAPVSASEQKGAAPAQVERDDGDSTHPELPHPELADVA